MSLLKRIGSCAFAATLALPSLNGEAGTITDVAAESQDDLLKRIMPYDREHEINYWENAPGGGNSAFSASRRIFFMEPEYMARPADYFKETPVYDKNLTFSRGFINVVGIAGAITIAAILYVLMRSKK